MKPSTILQIAVVVIAALVFGAVGLDAWQQEKHMRNVAVRADVTPDLLDLHRREYKMRVSWCKAWVDASLRRACQQDALLSYQSAVE